MAKEKDGTALRRIVHRGTESEGLRRVPVYSFLWTAGRDNTFAPCEGCSKVVKAILGLKIRRIELGVLDHGNFRRKV